MDCECQYRDTERDAGGRFISNNNNGENDDENNGENNGDDDDDDEGASPSSPSPSSPSSFSVPVAYDGGVGGAGQLPGAKQKAPRSSNSSTEQDFCDTFYYVYKITCNISNKIIVGNNL